MDRREALGSLLAVFTGVLLPRPVRESIWVLPQYPYTLDETMKIIFDTTVRWRLRDGTFGPDLLDIRDEPALARLWINP